MHQTFSSGQTVNKNIQKTSDTASDYNRPEKDKPEKPEQNEGGIVFEHAGILTYF
jgi:hypothetical protein